MNDWLAMHLSKAFATMWFFWFCLLLTLLPISWPASLPIVQFISSGVLQLIALPLLAVYGVILGRAAEQRAAQDHAAIMELVQELHDKHDAAHGEP